jgi:hypothetical protein
MIYDNEWLQQTLAQRAKTVKDTIHPVSIDELKALGSARFPLATDVWYEKYHEFLREHPDGDYYLANTAEGAEIVYCHKAARGIWFLPGQGMGVLQQRGLKFLHDLVAAR